MQNTAFSVNKTLNIKGRLIDLSKPLVMGVLNVTPDSFYDGGRYVSEKQALDRTAQMLKDGAAIIDIGGYSSRPGAADITAEDELNRIHPFLKLLRNEFPEAILSVDTFRSNVAKVAVSEGADMINDIAGGTLDAQMFETIASLKVPYVMMHMKGNPQTMTQHATYENLLKEVIDFFHPKLATLHELGVKDIIIDPGFGFAKTREHNFELLNQLELLKILGKPLLVGLSRKSMIWKTLNIQPEDALNGTTVLNTVALLKGASILRVHDVAEATQAVKLVNMVTAS